MKKSASFHAPPGFRDSPEIAINLGEVVASTYAIREELARTETGMVFEARDMLLDRPVVMKLAWRDPGTPSLITEARRCAAVSDPCAVAVYGMGNHHGLEFVVGERVTGALLRDALGQRLPHDAYLARLRTLIAAVARAHEAGIAIGDISGTTVLVDADGRMVLGRLSLSQVPAFGPLGRILAPEVVRGEVDAADPAAAEAIDLYGLGCVAIELARGTPPFADTRDPIRGHGHEAPPRLSDARDDLPAELDDLVEWLLAKQPAARPSSARDVLAQLDAVIERHGTKGRTVHVLIVDDDTARARWLWSLVRRADPAAVVEIASEGTDAAHKLNRDHPDLVFIDATLRGVMNALELCMYARGLDHEERTQLILIGDVSERDRALFVDAVVPTLPEDVGLANAVIARVRTLSAATPRRRKSRSTVSG
ncbi:MAG: response regulator [Deltaproteobacteria bacterium]|nr:response regulator [Deltaproteobacteria bacterium]